MENFVLPMMRGRKPERNGEYVDHREYRSHGNEQEV